MKYLLLASVLLVSSCKEPVASYVTAGENFNSKGYELTDTQLKTHLNKISTVHPMNKRILKILEQEMPDGGSYSIKQNAVTYLKASLKQIAEDPTVTLKQGPSYCTSATYLVFVKAMAQSLKALGKTPSPILFETSAVGSKIFGRWNANGPGTAAVFKLSNLGPNVLQTWQALPGDFMKIVFSWGPHIGGNKERGHSVIYLGDDQTNSNNVVFWSSNGTPSKGGKGFGAKSIPKENIYFQVYSRLENPENLQSRSSNFLIADENLKNLETKEVSVDKAISTWIY